MSHTLVLIAVTFFLKLMKNAVSQDWFQEGKGTTLILPFNLECKTRSSMSRTHVITGKHVTYPWFHFILQKRLELPPSSFFTVWIFYKKSSYKQSKNQIICIHIHKILLSKAKAVLIAHTDEVKTIQPLFLSQ